MRTLKKIKRKILNKVIQIGIGSVTLITKEYDGKDIENDLCFLIRGIQMNNEHGTWNLEHGTWSKEHGTWIMEHGTWNMEY